jgi:hypothetical protein
VVWGLSFLILLELELELELELGPPSRMEGSLGGALERQPESRMAVRSAVQIDGGVEEPRPEAPSVLMAG